MVIKLLDKYFFLLISLYIMGFLSGFVSVCYHTPHSKLWVPVVSFSTFAFLFFLIDYFDIIIKSHSLIMLWIYSACNVRLVVSPKLIDQHMHTYVKESGRPYIQVPNPLSPHHALKHDFTSLKTGLISLQLGVLERKFQWNWFTNT